ncbi:MAG: hypothetical protein LBD12_05980 [Clostridiales Family XIII bacterium]|jgi:hypothetical protein|nr:hypothetical protein [Clostridiales Family XIII bacterium]
MAEKLIDRYGNEFERLKLMFTIVARGKGDKVVQELRNLGITYNLASIAYGAVGQDLSDMFGLTESDYDLVCSVITKSKVKAAMSMIEYKFSLNEPGTGIAFCVPITGVGGPLSLQYISGTDMAQQMWAEEED